MAVQLGRSSPFRLPVFFNRFGLLKINDLLGSFRQIRYRRNIRTVGRSRIKRRFYSFAVRDFSLFLR